MFEITLGGALTTLDIFNGSTTGGNPNGSLLQAAGGMIYGAAAVGGVDGSTYGTIFRMTPDGLLTNLHTFIYTEGITPNGGLIQASDGNIYGTTYDGGAKDKGTVYQITPQGVLTVLHNFTGADGANPGSGLMQASDGYLYGTTWDSGPGKGGTVFRLALPK